MHQLLTHTSGLPSGLLPPGITARSPDDLVNWLRAATPVRLDGGSLYSDMGMFLLGWMAETATETDLFSLANRLVFKPLHLDFRVRVDPKSESVAATRECPGRHRVLQGEPQNLGTYAWGRLAGHAGLFGQVHSLLDYGRAWLDWRLLPWPREFSWQAVQAYVVGRGLGWMLSGNPQFVPDASWPPDAFGHTGFTGTAIAVVPCLDLVAVLLSNRTHGRPLDDTGRDIASLRSSFFGTILALARQARR